jgi:hypothetical protein
MKPLKNKYFVLVHESVNGAIASAVAEIFVCFMRALESMPAGWKSHDRTLANFDQL